VLTNETPEAPKPRRSRGKSPEAVPQPLLTLAQVAELLAVPLAAAEKLVDIGELRP
jgi:hypothetical protein